MPSPKNVSTPPDSTVRCTYSWSWYLAAVFECVVAVLMLHDFITHLGARDFSESVAFGAVIVLLLSGLAAFLLSPWEVTLEHGRIVGCYLLRPRRSWPAHALVIKKQSGALSAAIGAYAVRTREGRMQFVVWPQLQNLDELVDRLS